MTATTPVLVSCRRCGSRVLEVRWDWHGDTLIGEPHLDPVTLDPQQITACVIAGIPIWQVHQRANKTMTSRRSRWWPRSPVPGHIAPEHGCGRVWDAFPLDLAPDPSVVPEHCPF